MSDTAKHSEGSIGIRCHLGVTHHDFCKCREELTQRVSELESQNRRYRQALERINLECDDGCSMAKCTSECACQIAKSALAEPASNEAVEAKIREILTYPHVPFEKDLRELVKLAQEAGR